MARLLLPRLKTRPRSSRGLAGLLLGAAIYASAELAAGLLIGRFFAWGRAEALLFFAFRPWFLLIAALRMAESRWQRRFILYSLALVLAGISQSLFLIRMGADHPWPEMFRGLAGGAMLVLLFDLVIQAGCRFARRRGKLLATVLLAAALLIPGALRPWERLVLGSAGPTEPAQKPRLLVMTSLPIIWGEAGPFDPASRPAQSWLELQREFAPEPVDYLDEQSLANARLMLIAQPRRLAPEELVAIDAWVRRGGRALLLADPALVWPSVLPPGDPRRAVATNMLTPLLSHWGLAIETPDRPGVEIARLATGGSRRLLRLAGAGRLRPNSRHCRLEASFIADCRIGAGRAIVVADADLLNDALSVAPGNARIERHNRLSDNVPTIADWLDRLGGLERDRASSPVQWADSGASRSGALILGLIPALAVLMLALLLDRFRRGGNSLTYPQHESPRNTGALGRTNHE